MSSNLQTARVALSLQPLLLAHRLCETRKEEREKEHLWTVHALDGSSNIEGLKSLDGSSNIEVSALKFCIARYQLPRYTKFWSGYPIQHSRMCGAQPKTARPICVQTTIHTIFMNHFFNRRDSVVVLFTIQYYMAEPEQVPMLMTLRGDCKQAVHALICLPGGKHGSCDRG